MRQLLAPNFSINVANDYDKEMKKFELAWGLLRMGKNFKTDISIDGYPAKVDIFDEDSRIAYVIIRENQGHYRMQNKSFSLEFIVLPSEWRGTIPVKKTSFSLSISRRTIIKRNVQRVRSCQEQK